MDRVPKVDQAKVGLIIIIVAELAGTGLNMVLRLAPRFTESWMWQLYGVASFCVTLVVMAGLLVLTLAVRDQALGWAALSVGALEAVLGLASSLVSASLGKWFYAFDVALYGVGVVALLLAVALVARDVFPWLVALAACFAVFAVGGVGWSIARIVLEQRQADASAEVQALRLLLSLVISGGLVAVPTIAWVGLGRVSPPRGAQG